MKGDPASGLLPNVEPFDPSARAGDGDRRVQAYCFRMCLTDVPENRIPFVKPAGCRELDYELLFRNFEAQAAAAALAIDGGTSVQDVDYGRLRARLAADGIPLPK